MSDYTLIIILTFVGFTALAAVLLVPVYRFLKREERAGRKWTEEHQRAERHDLAEPPEPWQNGSDGDEPTQDAP